MNFPAYAEIIAVSNAFTRAAQSAARAAEEFLDAWFAGIEDAYLVTHKRLPGGRTNARLFKKRRDILLRWFDSEIGRK